MDGQRKALIVANDQYDNEALRRLKAPAADARALAHVLGDRDIGGFQVDVVLNEPAHSVEARIEDLFTESQSDDLLLLHFSCHGLKSEAGELFFAARNTRPDRLGSTAISADFIQRCIKSCRARSVVLFLDCCYGGAFGQGVAVRASGSANVLESFPAGKLGGGKGRAVITASSSMEYAFEGNHLADDHQQQPSLFTSALVEGLETGEADRDEDGLVSLNELYEFVFDKVREQNPNQTPSRDVEMQGELYVAQSRRKRIRPVPIPVEVQTALLDSNMFTRLGAVSELRARLNSEDIGAALGAQAALLDLLRTDIKYVGDAAAEALAGAALHAAPTELNFGQVAHGAEAAPMTLRLSGPPISRTCTVSTTDPWIRVEDCADGHVVSVDTSVDGRFHGSVTVKGSTGEAVVPVHVEVLAPAVVAEPEPDDLEPVDLEPVALEPVDLEPEYVQPKPVDVSPEPVEVMARQAAAPPAVRRPAATGAEPPAPAGDPSYGVGSRLLAVSGRLAVVGGPLLVLGLFLPFRYDAPMRDEQPHLPWYLVLLGALALAGGLLTLMSGSRRWLGPGLVLGSGAAATWGPLYLWAAWVEGDTDGFKPGLQVAVLTHLLLIAAGCLAAVGLARLDEVRIRGLSTRDRLEWLIPAIALAGALVMFAEGSIQWNFGARYGGPALWMAVLAFAVPTFAVLLHPRRLGLAVLVGWLVGALAVTSYYWSWLGKATDGDTPKIDLFATSLLALAVATVAWGRKLTRNLGMDADQGPG